MGSNSHNNRFPLPENWSVEDFVCMVVPVPNDPEYTATIMGLIETLTWSRSFHHHSTENAARQVADTWAAAFESREIQFKKCEDIDMSYDTRVKPGYPYIQQASIDGGLTWHDSLILPHWAMSSAVWPDGTTDTQAADVAGGITDAIGPYIAGRIIAMDGDGFSRDTIANDLYAEFGRFLPLPEMQAKIRPMVNALLDAPTPTAYADECEWSNFWGELRDFIKGHPNNFGSLLSNWFFDLGQSIGDDVIASFADFYMSLAGNDAFYNYLANRESLHKHTFLDACTDTFWWRFEGDDPPYTSEHGQILAEGEGGGNCLGAITGHYDNGVNLSNGPVFYATLTHGGTITGLEARYRAVTTPGYSGIRVRVLDETGAIQYDNGGTGAADDTWYSFGVAGVSIDVDAGWKIQLLVNNSDTVAGNLDGNRHNIDNIQCTGAGIRF